MSFSINFLDSLDPITIREIATKSCIKLENWSHLKYRQNGILGINETCLIYKQNIKFMILFLSWIFPLIFPNITSCHTIIFLQTIVGKNIFCQHLKIFSQFVFCKWQSTGISNEYVHTITVKSFQPSCNGLGKITVVEHVTKQHNVPLSVKATDQIARGNFRRQIVQFCIESYCTGCHCKKQRKTWWPGYNIVSILSIECNCVVRHYNIPTASPVL